MDGEKIRKVSCDNLCRWVGGGQFTVLVSNDYKQIGCLDRGVVVHRECHLRIG